MPEQLWPRMRRALLLEGAAYEEFRDDNSSTAALVVLAVAGVFLAGLGAWLWGETVLEFTPDGWFVDTFILGSIFTILLFLAGFGVTYIVLTQVYRETMEPDALARVLALGYLPFAVGFFVFIPEFGFGIGVLSVAAMFFYTVFGLRAAYPAVAPARIVVASLAGFAVWCALLPLIGEFPNNNFATGIFSFGLIA